MERKKTALALAAVIVVSITGVVGVWSALNTTSELRFTGTPYDYTLYISNFANATIFVDFENDPTLMYRLSYEPYSGSHGLVAEYYYNTSGFLTSIGYEGSAGTDDEGHTIPAQIKTLNLTLGSNLPATVNVNWIHNCTIIMICDGSVTAVDNRITFRGYSDTVAYLQLTEDASIEQQLAIGFECGALFLDIDLPDGVNGQIMGLSGTIFDVNHNVGWTYDGSRTYQTPEIAQPLFYVGTSAGVVHLWLND